MSSGPSERGATKYREFPEERMRTGGTSGGGIRRPKFNRGYNDFDYDEFGKHERYYKREAQRSIADMRKLDRKLKAAGMAKERRLSLFAKAYTGRYPWDSISDIGGLLDRGYAPEVARHTGSWYLASVCSQPGSTDLGYRATLFSASSICINSLNLNPPADPLNGWILPAGQPLNARAHHCWYGMHGNPTLSQRRSAVIWRTTVNPSRQARFYPNFDVWRNPNLQRYQQSIRPDRDPLRELEKQVERELATQEMLLQAPPPRQSVALSRSMRVYGRPERVRPQSGKEGKFISRSVQLLIAMFKALDDISELSELVSAFYDALPKSIRDQYDQESRGLLDGAGQYGIDGADWKAQAIYKHFGEIDVQQAVKNIVNNHLQDQLLGGANKYLPPQGGQALGDGLRELNDIYQSGWNEVVG